MQQTVHRGWIAVLAWVLSIPSLSWGLGPQNILIITSQKSPEGMEIANYYCEKRDIPKVNIVRTRLGIDNEHISWDKFQRYITEFAENHIDRYGLRDRIWVWVTTTATPVIVEGNNSVSGVVYFGKYIKPTPVGEHLAGFSMDNRYFDVMNGYRRPKDAMAGGYLHMRLDAGSAIETRALIDRGLRAEGSHPPGTIYLFDGESPRDVRKDGIPPAMRLLDMVGIKTEHRAGWSLVGATDVLGWQTGIPQLDPSRNEYRPGALADHLTSFGGTLRAHRGQTPAIEFLKAGCSATYGTVVEPLALPTKFPLAHLFAYYGLGFTAVESYWMSVAWPQQGLFLGDPLARPFDMAPSIEAIGLAPEREVSGVFDFEAAAETMPPGPGVRRLAVYIDRKVVHVRQFSDVEEGTSVAIRVGGKNVDYVADRNMSLAEFVAGVGKEVVRARLQSAFKPGLIIIFPPAGSDPPSVRCSSPLVSAEILGQSPAESPAATSEEMTWTLKGKSGEGDRMILVIHEDDREVATLTHVATFPRPAGSLCTSFWLEANKQLPKGYRLEKDLEPKKAEFGVLRLVTDPAVVKGGASAGLRVEPAAGSTLSVSGEGEAKSLAAAGPTGGSIIGVRFGLGAPKLRTRPRIDSTPFPDGRHELEIIATRGSSTDSASRRAIPIIIRNKEPRLRVEAMRAEGSVSQPGKVAVAKAIMPENVPGFPRFFIDGVETAPADVQDGVLMLDPAEWGEGEHEISCRIVDGVIEVLYSDNAVRYSIGP